MHMYMEHRLAAPMPDVHAHIPPIRLVFFLQQALASLQQFMHSRHFGWCQLKIGIHMAFRNNQHMTMIHRILILYRKSQLVFRYEL